MKITAIIAIGLFAGVLSAETFQIDLSAGGTIQFVGNKAKGEKKGNEAVKVININGKKRPQINWNVKDSPYLVFSPKKNMVINNYSSLVVKLKFEVLPGCPITAINLRFLDKNNEVFQYRKNVDLKRGGIFNIEIPVDKKHFSVCWGGNPPNKVVDQPIKDFHIAFNYSRKTAQTVKVIFHSVKAETVESQLTVVKRPLYEIGDCTQFFRVSGNASIQVMPRVLNIFGINKFFRFSEKKDSLIPYTEPIDGLQIDACMLTGTAAIRASFCDAAKKRYLTKSIPLTGKRTEVFLPFPNEKGIKYPVYLDYIELNNTGKMPGSTAIYSVCNVMRQNRLDSIDFAIGTDTRFGVLRKGHEKALNFQFINRSSRKGEYTADVTIQHYSGRRLKEHFAFTLSPGKTVVEPKMKPDLWGHWDVIAEIREKTNLKESVKKESAFAYLNPAGPTPGRAQGFLFSICTHTERWSLGEQTKEIEALSLCGAKVARVGNTWGGLQPSPNEWRWEPLDRIVDNYGAVGVEVQYLLGYPPLWATRKEFHKLPWIKWSRSAPDDAIWRKYVSDMVKHFRGRIFYWENWNEPDLGVHMTNAEYIRMQKSTFEEIRKAAPEAIVMTGGFGTLGYHHARKNNPHFYDDFFKGAKGSFDVHAQHEHGTFAAYAAVIDGKFFPIRKKYGITGPWYSNETAIPSMDGAVRLQAETLFKKLLYSWARGAIGYTWYDLRNDGFSLLDPEHNCGMMTNDFVPKPVYSVFNMLVGTFRNAKFVRQWNLGKELWVFEFQDGVKRYLAAWDESQFAASHPVRIVTDAKNIAKLDLMGNKTKVPLYNGCCIFNIGNEPVVLEFCNCKKLICAGELIEFNAKGVAVPGIRYPVKTVIYNPWKQKVTFTLSIAGITKEVQIAAGGKTGLIFETIPTQEPLRLKWENTIGMKGVITIPVYTAKIIPAGSFEKRAPDFILNKRAQVHSLVEAFPGTAHRVWKGPKDQSVKGWAGVFGNELKLRFDVTDDVHKQPHSGSEVWMSDSIQLAFEIPGQAGYWELGLSRLDSGKSEVVLSNTPSGIKSSEVLKTIRLTTTRTGDLTQYQLSIPFSALKTTAENWKSGVRLNFIVNEDDGEGRDGWLQYAPGIGTAKNPSKFPLMIFQ